MTSPHATAVAHPNLALIKYWGKRDHDLVLPCTGSLSLTLDVFPTRTSVRLDPELTNDRLILNEEEVTGNALERVRSFLDIVRERSGQAAYAHVESRNSVPTGAGLASSASGFAALATAASSAYGLPTDSTALSRLARRGSGSACRSVIADLAVWHAGDGEGHAADATSYAEQVPGPRLAMVIAVVSAAQKSISSRVAMKLTAESSPFFDGWVSGTTADLDDMQTALTAGDYTRVGELTESNALRMHAAINGTRPAIRYLAPTSVALFDAAAELREDGLEVYATADAGPNVAILCREDDLERTRAAFAVRFPDLDLIAARSGPGAYLTEGE
ncbi:diphosphomevalonate decarboxylase [Kocuria sp. HSID16901]|uniref:diphosphomevalonate decarboxylase n=1 Tax=Kocuria sp. HSID16901 TaxID=2419505 RepID=UPI0006618045|nr:diphosphomevalonate decarboxylase [Kocuria sp. HSID16901]MCT1366924.1 diphosphomevalonate decarboxylase [Rothia sp. p3-SID1597]RUQ20071.1 diphosphomevalonate decarboxylase [Kocuria sp. HSID16901]